MKVWSYAKKRETERRKEDSLRQSRNVTDVRETEKEKPIEAQNEAFLEEITDWINELEEDKEYLKSIKTKKTKIEKVCESIFSK